MASGPHDTPSTIVAEQGEVHVDGPGGTTLSMTPAAAAETSERLLKAARDAAAQSDDRDGQTDPR